MKKIIVLGNLLLLFLLTKQAYAVDIYNPAPGFFASWGGNNTFAGILVFAINIGLSIAGLVAVLFIIYGGFQYMTSAGNEERAETGRRTLVNAIIGLVVIILSYVIVSVINNAFG